MKSWHVVLILAIAVTVLAGCGGEQTTPAPADTGSSGTYTSAVLDTSYPDALDVRSQLALGTIQLEEAENGVTPAQATALLPFWQALQGGVTAQAEVDAVLAQIEGTMTSEQLAAVAAMQLTQDDLRAWAQSQGLGVPPGGGPGQMGGGQDLSPEERATRQAERGGGQEPSPEMATRRAEFESMSEEEREALRATAQAGGGIPGGAGGWAGAGSGAGGRQFIILLNPLIELLTERAAE
ncbi:MAG: hypothetical protein KAX24_01560 [Anaerolineae bacterium]|nr:hypothetical protein [Anaerolineae bacterium]